MISEEELIKHKWKYIPESKSWEKLGVSFRDVNRALNHYTVFFVGVLTTSFVVESLEELENLIKRYVSIIFSIRMYHSPLSIKQKRTLKNWIL
jgi:hypothetical protein